MEALSDPGAEEAPETHDGTSPASGRRPPEQPVPDRRPQARWSAPESSIDPANPRDGPEPITPDGQTMRLPRADAAVVDPAKVRDYLLSPEHPVGRYKAAFFASLGYTRADWQSLQRDLLDLPAREEAVPGQPSDFGQKYEVRGTLQGPAGRRTEVVTVWIILTGETTPRFVTAFPGETP